jgi:peptidoglycan glycosyltransferase
MRIAQYHVYRPERRDPWRHRPGGPRKPSKLGRLRVTVWVTVSLVLGLLSAGWRHLEERANLDQAREAFSRYDIDAAEDALSQGFLSPWVRHQALAARALVAMLRQREPSDAERRALGDGAPVPLAGLIASAFARGHHAEVLRLDALARAQGEEGSQLLVQASLVELGREREVQKIAAGRDHSPLRLRLAQHLGRRTDGDLLLRDRDGALLGTTDGGVLHLEAGIEPELVPRFVATLPEAYGSTGAIDLTLDLELSRIALRALDRFRGSIVVLDPRNGDVLAAVSDSYSFALGGSPALEQMREPASIAKLLTSTAALRAGVDPDAYLSTRVCRGQEHYDGEVLYCPSIAGRLHGLDKAMAVSCNVAFASLGNEIGRACVVDEYRRFGFDRPLGLFPSGHVLQAEGNARQLADLSIGLEATEITPLHAASLAGVIANGGVLVEPRMVLATDGRLGFHRRPLAPTPGERLLEPRWMPMIRQAMAAVVERGTAHSVSTPGFPVAMKTGTASAPEGGFHVNYIGFGPLGGDDRLAFCVRITDQGSSRRVRSVASVVTGHLLEELHLLALQRGWRLPAPAAPPAQQGILLARLRPGAMPFARHASDDVHGR